MSAGSRIAPDVSVIIAAWKAAGFIENAIASALSSTGVVVEVIAVDDASPDGTWEALDRLAAGDGRVKTDRLPVNSGPSAARNRAIELAGGRYVAVLDADDAIKPDRLASLVALADTSGADIVVDNMTEIDEAGGAIGDKPFLKSAAFVSGRDIDLATWAALNHPMKGNDCLGYLKPLVRRSRLVETGVRYDPTLRNSEDYYFIAHLLAAGTRMTYSPEPGYLYRRSAASTSHRLKPSQTRAWLDAEQRFRASFDARLPEAAKTVLDERGRALRDVHQFVAALDAMKAGKIGDFLGVLASDLRALGFTLSTLAKIAVGKAMRRKMV